MKKLRSEQKLRETSLNSRWFVKTHAHRNKKKWLPHVLIVLFNSVKMSTIEQLKFKSMGYLCVTQARSMRPDNNTIRSQLAFSYFETRRIRISFVVTCSPSCGQQITICHLSIGSWHAFVTLANESFSNWSYLIGWRLVCVIHETSHYFRIWLMATQTFVFIMTNRRVFFIDQIRSCYQCLPCEWTMTSITLDTPLTTWNKTIQFNHISM